MHLNTAKRVVTLQYKLLQLELSSHLTAERLDEMLKAHEALMDKFMGEIALNKAQALKASQDIKRKHKSLAMCGYNGRGRRFTPEDGAKLEELRIVFDGHRRFYEGLRAQDPGSIREMAKVLLSIDSGEKSA